MKADGTTIIVRLGDDMNWWLDTREESASAALPAPHGVLDPRQVRHLVESAEGLRAHGFAAQSLAAGLQAFAIQAELAEGVLQLVATDDNLLNGEELFALPRIDADGDGAYFDLLDALGVARVGQLNATHEYSQACTVDDMQEELEALEQDRYFSAENIHAFDAISEILDWAPAEWDDADPAAR